MRQMKLLTFILCVTFFAGMIAAVGAQAVEDVYKQEKANLLEGEFREITVKAATELVLKTEQEKSKAETKCKALKLNAGEHPEIFGGTPGTSKNEKLELQECSATVNSEKCTSVEVEATKWNNELVTVAAPAGLKGKLATVFTPASGTPLLKIKFNSCGKAGSFTAEVEGSTAAVTSPEGVFESTGTWAWSEKEQITEVETSSGAKKSVGLKSSKLGAKLNGEAQVVAALAWLSRTNVGGVPVLGSNHCEFTAAKQTCQIQFKNITTRTIAAIGVTFFGANPAGRYSRIMANCVLNLGLGECTDEVEAIKIEAKGINDYCLEVKDQGTGERNSVCATLRM